MTNWKPEHGEVNPLAMICEKGLNWATEQGVGPYLTLWVLPRTELLSVFKAHWCKAWGQSQTHFQASIWQGFAPRVLTADRLSQPWPQAEWMRLLSRIIPILQNLPHISGHLSGVALWTLAEEYLQLAFRLHVLQTSIASLGNSHDSLLTSAEAQVIFVLRQHCADVFEDWLKAPSFHEQPRSQRAVGAIVWVDDGEAWPQALLQRWYPEVPLLRLPLPAIQGAEPWQRLAHRLLLQSPQATLADAGQPKLKLRWQAASDEAATCDWAAAWVLHWLRDSISHSTQQNDAKNHMQPTHVNVEPGASIEPITIVAVDRLLARRLCAVLANRGVLVDDRTGWVLSTARVSAWFDALIQAAMHPDGVQTFVHPFKFSVASSARDAQDALEAHVQEAPDNTHLKWPVPWRLGQTNANTLSQWANTILKALDEVDCTCDLDADSAGIALLNVLREWAALNIQASAEQAQAMSTIDCFLAWRYAAEHVRFRPLDVVSPVRILPLLSTRLQPNGKVLVLGCAQSHFQQSPPGLLPPSVMAELGLLSPTGARIQKLSALYELLWYAPEIVLIHAEYASGKPQAALSEIEYLKLLLHQHDVEALPAFERLLLKGSPMVSQPLQLCTALKGQARPEQIRVTAFDDWVLCPLRFGLKHAVPWFWHKPMTSVYAMQGILVHRWLQEVARKVSQVKPKGFMACQAILEETLLQVWKHLSASEQVALYLFRQQLQNSIKPLAGVLEKRIEEGWLVRSAEERVVGMIDVGQDAMKVVGRVDWVEVRNTPEGPETCIVDIKWKNKADVQKLAKDPESAPQLPIYQHLMQMPKAQLVYWFVQPNHSAYVPVVELPAEIHANGFDDWGAWMLAKIQDELQVFFSESNVWSQNPGDACLYCSVKGICRPNVLTGSEHDTLPISKKTILDAGHDHAK